MKTTDQYLEEVAKMSLNQMEEFGKQSERAKGYQMAIREIIAFARTSNGDPGTLARLVDKLGEMNKKTINDF